VISCIFCFLRKGRGSKGNISSIVINNDSQLLQLNVTFGLGHLCLIVVLVHNIDFVVEMELGTKCVVDMDHTQTVLYNPGLILKDG